MPPTPQRSAVEIGTIVANTYEISRLLGRGGMGAVWEANHRRLPGKRVAIKILHGHIAEDSDALVRFRREAEIACRLGHPNIVEVHDFNFLEDGSPYLILELLQGEGLDELMSRGPLDLGATRALIEQIGSALTCAHAQGVIHRDLKPQNIFVSPNPSSSGSPIAKLLDFGISKIHGSMTVRTQDSTLLGTPQYMAPEQATGNHSSVDGRTDLFALAAIVYEMLSGRATFAGESIPEVVYKVVHADPEPIATLCPNLPAGCQQAIMRGLAKKQTDRFPNVAAFVTALLGNDYAPSRERTIFGTGAGQSPARQGNTAQDLERARTVDSSKLDVERARTVDSSKLDIERARTVDSSKLDIERARTVDSSKLDIASSKRRAEDDGDIDTQDETRVHASLHLDLPADARSIQDVVVRELPATGQPSGLRRIVVSLVVVCGVAAVALALNLGGDERKQTTSATMGSAPASSPPQEPAVAAAAYVPPHTATASEEPTAEAKPRLEVGDASVSRDQVTSRDTATGLRRPPDSQDEALKSEPSPSENDSGPPPEIELANEAASEGEDDDEPGDTEEPSNPDVATLLAEGEDLLQQLEFERAWQLGREANALSETVRGLMLQARASCGLRDIGRLNAVRDRIPRTRDRQLVRQCKRLGFSILPRSRRER